MGYTVREAKSSILLYVLYRYLFAFLIVSLTLSMVDDFIHGNVPANFQGCLFLGCIFLVFQIIACLVIFRATVSKEVIRFNNGRVIAWGDVQCVVRFRNVYLLKVKNEARCYLFPVERQIAWFFGDNIKYTQMDQIINIKPAGYSAIET